MTMNRMKPNRWLSILLVICIMLGMTPIMPWMQVRAAEKTGSDMVTQLAEEGEVENSTGMQASMLLNLSNADVIRKVGTLFTADMQNSGILASVSLAQFILESGYGKSGLTQNANNVFGMKKNLSGNTWSGSTWDGSSVYTRKTQEDDGTGMQYSIIADFRKYSCIEDSIADHSAYLLGAMDGSKLRYEGLKGCTDYKEAVQIIKDGGYATNTTYVSRICSIIEQWNLTQYDTAEWEPEKKVVWYYVRKCWQDASSQKGAFEVLEDAKACADADLGFSVFDETGEIIYTGNSLYPDVPFLVKVPMNDLKIYPGPGVEYSLSGSNTGRGVFTIIEVQSGQGSTTGWGHLKSGAGWINLDFCTYL